ncbi:RNA-directed DNA polymerase from mobile element jockey [Amphibalanus amphitrite]|uniref:RNA-directed DNA polymerase from mobile element jockey n=1 Tax=Amphibalanus amphitrite TaxID=1232801 RepID=A0A6A4WWA1_AMPAM|nr:RNA-directed DNA polymerase from mobile element jockey [Amphibalanus amphitrite]
MKVLITPSELKVDVLAVQEAQLPSGRNIAIPGYQAAAVARRAQGRRRDGPIKGGDVAIYVRDGLSYSTIEASPLLPQDTTTEWCAIKIIPHQMRGQPSRESSSLNIYNLYRPPSRLSAEDEREDHFSLDMFPSLPNVIAVGDINGHHPVWDVNCSEPDAVGTRVNDWLELHHWVTLNSGAATCVGYGNRTRQTAPDVAMCHRDMAGRCTWAVGEDLGSDHLPQLIHTSIGGARPKRIRKSRWAFHKADWTGFAADCDAALADLRPDSLSVEGLSERLVAAILSASTAHVPRGARADPKPWALDPDLVAAVAERREARDALKEHDSEEARSRWKTAKKSVATMEAEAQKRSFRELATGELNKPAAIGKVTKILRKMEGAAPDVCPDRAINGDCGQLLAEDRAKAEAFVRTYAHVSRNVRQPKRDRIVKTELRGLKAAPCCCRGQRTDQCQPFTEQEMHDQIRHLGTKKAPGPDQVCTEHLRHLGPTAYRTLLALINRSWSNFETPASWRRATIIPILKAGKDPKQVGSYRPIALTSHIAKLAERMIAARTTYLIERDRLVPPEQVGFRRGRSAEDSLARLVQTVQDGWNRPKPRRGPEDGVTADRFVLLAFDFSRAYDTIDHRMLHLKLLKLLPRCFATWIFRFLRDRRARVEVNGAHSSERVFRAGLPQGSVLAPTIYTLWAADLIETLRNASDRTDVLMYADDTATLSAGATVELAVARAQKSADALARWARHWKMSIAGQKTQALLLTQRSRDERGVQLLVNGTQVTGGTSLHLLGVTFDRLLHFKDHCDSLRRKVRPRTAQLRRMTGRTWGLREAQLRTVANGYVRGALEYAAGAWLPAASPSHVQLVERELLAAARVVTGCPRSTPRDPLLAEAGIPSAWSTRKTLAARTLCRALALPEDDPLRRVAEADLPTRLRSTTGWRQLGRSALIEAGAEGVTVEPRLEVPLLPWTTCRPIAFNLDVGPGGRRASSNETRREAARQHLAALPAQATWIWSDGSADAGVRRGGGGAVIFTASGETLEVEVAAGGLCSSTRAELFALRAALERVRDEPSPAPLVACSDSRAALSLLSAGAAAQTTTIGAAIWRTLLDIAERRQVTLQWVPAHCGLAENERADALAKQAATLPQGAVPSDARSLTRAVHRTATRQWRENWPDSFFKTIFGSTLPLPIPGEDREAAISVHQLRAGHWGRSLQYLHRIGRHPSVACLQCPDKRCPAALCAVCREEADVPEHVLLRCPALAGARLRLTGSIYVDPSRLRDADLVAALEAGYLRHREPLGYGPP